MNYARIKVYLILFELRAPSNVPGGRFAMFASCYLNAHTKASTGTPPIYVPAAALRVLWGFLPQACAVYFDHHPALCLQSTESKS